MIQIKFKDVDPDTGNISQEMAIATCETTEHAKWIIEALYKHSEEPNRDFFREIVTGQPATKDLLQIKGQKKKMSDAEAKQKAKEIDDEMFRHAAIAESTKEAEAKQKAKEIDDEVRRQYVLKSQAEHKVKQATKESNNKRKGPPPNNGYVPYDQFKF